ncbi:outer membrane beta-barrel protein [Ferrovum sp.]|uniref:outer membrane beta-barrel protein n=1 Tax=Ferrovum sp. TaxID=2609467 RepID=UPI002603692C|nr:outer membrane beta-barrel protein [Ferrovum sp.]
MKSSVKQLTLAAIMSLAAASAMADMSAPTDTYVGGDLGRANAIGIGNSGTAYGAFIGHEWNKEFGVELGYNHFPSANGVSIYSISVTGFDTLYFDNAKTIGAVGVLGGNYSNASGYAGSSVSGVALSFGAGLRYNVTNNIETRLMYVRNDLANNTYYSQNAENLITLGVAYHF